jgi:tetratricopeptide (TPR) repeat protein
MNKIFCMGGLWLLRLLTVCLLTACATQTSIEPVTQEPEPAPVSESTPVEMPQTAEIPRTLPTVKPPAAVNIATDSLTNVARAQYQTKQYQSAIATAERGLRIDRRAAPLYLLLAQSYMQLDMPQKAMNFVQQGLRYATPESDTEFGLLRLREILQE